MGSCTSVNSELTDVQGTTVTCGDGPNCNNFGPKAQGGRGLTCWDPRANNRTSVCGVDQWQCSVNKIDVKYKIELYNYSSEMF